jgi:hypothetical protein
VSNGYSLEPLSVEDIEQLRGMLQERGIKVFDIVKKDILSDCTSTLFATVNTDSISREHWESLMTGRCYLEPRQPLEPPPVQVRRPGYIKRSEVRKLMIQQILEKQYLEDIAAKRSGSQVQTASEDGESENDSSEEVEKDSSE